MGDPDEAKEFIILQNVDENSDLLIGTVKKIYRNKKLNIIAVLDEDNKVFTVDLDAKNKSQILQNGSYSDRAMAICSFCWGDDDNDEELPWFVSMDTSDFINTFRLDPMGAHHCQERSCQLQHIKAWISHSSSSEQSTESHNFDLLAASGDKIVLLVDQITVLLLQWTDAENLEVKRSFKCGHEGGCCSSVKVVGRLLFMMQEKVIYVYALYEGEMLGSVDLDHYNISVGAETLTFDLTPDLQGLIILQEMTLLYCIDLNVHFRKLSTLKSTTKSPLKYTQTSRGHMKGNMFNTHWSERLQALDSKITPQDDSFSWLDYVDAPCDNLLANRPRRQAQISTTLSGLHLQNTSPSSARNSRPASVASRQTNTSRSDSRSSVRVKLQWTRERQSVINLPQIMEDCCVNGTSVAMDSCSVWISDCSSGRQAICVINLSSGLVKIHRLQNGAVPILSSSLEYPHFILYPKHLSAIMFSGTQQNFVNKLMVYDNASLADSVCKVNHWDPCSIPLRALQVGLRQRQLDTVAFFLKSKEGLFTSADDDSSEDAVDEFESAIDLLVSTIKSCMNEHQSKQFAEQLLHLTLDHLHKTVCTLLKTTKAQTKAIPVQELEKDQNEPDQHTLPEINKKPSISNQERMQNKMMKLILDLRCYMKDFPRARRRSPMGERYLSNDPYRLTEVQDEVLTKWSKMDHKECIEQGLASGQILLLQVHLKKRMGTEASSLAAILDFGLQSVVDHLLEKNLTMACQLLNNMGFDSTSKLHQICMYTSDRGLRDYLAAELRATNALSQLEEDMIRFTHQVESLYSCQSFETAKIIHQEDPQKCWNITEEWKNLLPEMKNSVTSKCGEIAHTEVVNAETSHYASLILEWVRSWDEVTRQQVLADILLSHRDTNYRSMITPGAFWKYLCCHGDMTRLEQWLEVMMSHAGREHAQTWPYMHPVTPEMVDDLHSCPWFIKNHILDQLARHNVFCSEETQDYNKKVARLSRVHRVMMPREEMNNADRYKFIELCVQQNLGQVLWYFLEHCGVSEDDSAEIEKLKESYPLLKMISQFQKVGSESKDWVNMFEASLANAGYLQRSFSVTVTQLLDMGQLRTALASLMFLPSSFQTISAEGRVRHPGVGNLANLEEALVKYPRLQAALFPSKHLHSSNQSDLNMYTLLQGNAPYDPSRLFGWQETNHLTAEESLKELPHFAHHELMSKYAYSEQLDYAYYLHHARPAFAFVSYVASLLEMGITHISNKRASSIRHKVTLLGIQNFHIPAIASACVAFIHIVGLDSVTLRLHIQVGELIREFYQNINDSVNISKTFTEEEISMLLVACIRHKRDYAVTVLSMLEVAITASITKNQIKRTSYEAAHCWTVAVMFCIHHQVALTDVYLRACAEEDDWLMFLTFAQLHQYPKEQLMELVLHFKSSHLQEHLHYVICNASSMDHSTQPDARKRVSVHGIRSQLYSRIGVKNAVREQDNSSSSDSNEDAAGSMAQTEISGPLHRQESLVRKDLVSQDVFGVLLSCLSSSNPWRALLAHSITFRNPILAVLASCCQDCDRLSCLCVWLLTSTTEAICREGFAGMSDREMHTWTLTDLFSVMHQLLSRHWSNTLAQGFRIFYKTSPLILFFDFCTTFHRDKNWDKCRNQLDMFKESMSKNARKQSDTHSTASSLQTSEVTPDLDDQTWLEETVTSFLEVLVVTNESSFLTSNLLKVLDSAGLARNFSCPVPDFGKINYLYQIVYNTGLTLDAVEIFDPKSTNFVDHCDHVITELQEHGFHSEARMFAEKANLSYPVITVNQAEQDLRKISNTGVWQFESARLQFWTHIHELFCSHQTQPLLVTAFLQRQLEKSGSLAEKCFLCELIYHWLSIDSTCDHQRELSAVFMDMWRCKIQMHINNKQCKEETKEDILNRANNTSPLSIRIHKDPTMQLIYCGKMPEEAATQPNVSLTKEESTALDELIGQLLASFQISEASQLTAEFGHFNQDLAIVVTCLRLAQEVIEPDEIDSKMKKLLAVPRKQRRSSSFTMGFPRATSSASLLSMTSVAMDTSDEKSERVKSMMESLFLHCQYDSTCCNRIINIYKVAQLLHMDYRNVVQDSAFEILRRLLVVGAFDLGREFMQTSSIPAEEIACFLGDTILKSLKVYTGAIYEEAGYASMDEGSKELLFSPEGGSTWLIQLTTLCEDAALLGSHLLDAVSSLLATEKAPSHAVLRLEVEMLICGHDCHTLACNTEGIVATLRVAHSCTVALHRNSQYNLMIRLLTGIARYGEMTYVFDILKQEHQFELLFKKGKDKDKNLKLAILDYLRHFHPTDSETLTMVSLHFTMYREIAQLLEEAAKKQLAKLQKKPLANTVQTSSALQHVVQFYSDAAESYIKDKCIHHAERCLKQAKLTALQLHLLPSGGQILHQKSQDIRHFIMQHNKFYEAYIVADAYHVKDDWVSALCHNVIHRGDFKYLTSFKSHLQLTPQVISDIAGRFKMEASKTVNMISNMKKLLSHCNDVSAAYRLALDLGFTDLSMDLTRGESGPFLKDSFSR